MALAGLGRAQSSPPPPALEAFPSEFFTIGVQYNNLAPHWKGWIAGAFCVHAPSNPCSGSYSFTGNYATPGAGGKLVLNYTTGAGQHMRDFGRAHVYAVLGAGASVSSTSSTAPTAATAVTNVGLALNGGLLTVIPIKDGFGVDLFTQAISSAGKTNVIVGVGFSWGK